MQKIIVCIYAIPNNTVERVLAPSPSGPCPWFCIMRK